MDMSGNSAFIITLTGPSMSGKTYVMNKIEQEADNLMEEGIDFHPVRIKKYTTRAYRLEEIKDRSENRLVDIESVAQIPDECDLVYRTYGMDYGVSMHSLQEQLNKNHSPIIVVNDVRVVEEIKSNFEGRVLSLFLFRKIPELLDFKYSSNSRGNVTSKEVKKRYKKAISIYRTYIENITLFNRVILNVKDYSGKKEDTDFTGIQVHNVIKGVINKTISLDYKDNTKSRKMFIISGGAASGKDEIIRAVEKLGKLQAFILPKYTTRAQEPDDGKEMICQFVPKESIMEEFRKKYKSEYQKIYSINIPDDVFFAKAKKKFNKYKTLYESFNEYLNVSWEAEKLKKLKDLPPPKQRFWKMIERKKKYLFKHGKDSSEIDRIIINDCFELNPHYVPIEKIYKENEGYFEKYTNNQEIGVSGPACYIEYNGIGYVVYKNNKDIIYAFILKQNDGVSVLNEKENRHCIIAASLTEIFNICKKRLSNEVVTIFAYSQISAENYKLRTLEGTAIAKANAFEKDIERYSKYIEYFDHVSIFAESVYGNKEGEAVEELTDQIFRIFRSYN